jgi:hypothetical protein
MPHLIIDRHQIASPGSRLRLDHARLSHGTIGVSDVGNKDSTAPVPPRTGGEIVSAVRMPERLTAAVDAWARTHHLSRSDAISKLVNLGLKIAPAAPASQRTVMSDATRIEEIAVHEIEHMLDPALSADERERRIRRLTEGPPEFTHERIDLPKHQT